MNQNHDENTPADPEETPTAQQPPVEDDPAPVPPPAPPAPPAAGPKARWRDRAYGVRSVAAVALAGLVLGAGAGTGITLIAHDGGDGHRGGEDGRFQRMGGPGEHGRFGGGFGPGGQLPPGTAPEEQDDSGQGSTEGSSNPVS